MNWHIGQEIVANQNHSQGFFKKGEVFTIKGLSSPLCKHSGVMINIGIDGNDYGALYCWECNADHPKTNECIFSELWFSALDELCDISEITEHLKTTAPYSL